jgi:pimeloyl-ACP methyl ester carboxylesterase
MKPQVICVPGSVAPAAQRYKPLIETVGAAADFQIKDLEVYREATPPADYSIEQEVEAIDRLADSKSLDRFHLVAYSGGGFISLAYAGHHPDRLLSLSLFEAARVPGPLTAEEGEFASLLATKLRGLQGGDFIAAFMREQVKPGVELAAPAGPVSPEMQKRPAGIAAMIRAFDEYPFERGLLRACSFPVFYAYGDLSHDEQALKAGVLARLFPDVDVRRFAGIHHFVPPEMIYTPKHAQLLVEHWRKAADSARELSRQ